MPPLRESNPLKVALVLWIGVLLVVRGTPWVQHQLGERQAEHAAALEFASWAPVVRDLEALPVARPLSRCSNDFADPDTFEGESAKAYARALPYGYPCWSGPGSALPTAAALVRDLRAQGATGLRPECARTPGGQVWCVVGLRLGGVRVVCSVRSEGSVRGAPRTDGSRVHLDCLPLSQGQEGPPPLPSRFPRVPLPL